MPLLFKERRYRAPPGDARESRGNGMLVATADLVTEFFRRRAKIIILTLFTYAALC